MGTRSTTFVTYKKQLKVAQYGQWDGYPDHVGLGILKVLRDGDRQTVLDSLDRTRWMTDEEINAANKFLKEKNAAVGEYFPLLTRDNAGDYIMETLNEEYLPLGKDEILLIEDSDTSWSEYVYRIDFDEGTFTVDDTEFQLDDLPSDEEFLTILNENEDE